ncbi:transcription termination/antitermination NusG family protein [uncultured Pelagimonas sp.]|uniref:transcription termination/antitermination protein NusG n=1 Tax=uncultured Pelagimonas sp. TaxID=1618102 RepID=UPI0026297FE3|nr:transcription termination/antitermination NusG family protein [uncultured Pelagimonas sp.]
MTQKWHLAQLKPNGLNRATVNLARQGFEFFAPMQKQGPNQRKQPLFPGYVFVRFDPADTQWRAINNTLGVARLVCLQSNRPNHIPAAVMQALQARCDVDGVLLPPKDLTPGDRVRITEGPFAGWVTEVAQMRGTDRVMVLLSLIGEENRAEMPTSQLHKMN